MLPDRLERCLVDGAEFEDKLAECDSAVYTVGLEAQNAAGDEAMGSAGLQPDNGILAPGLSGVGIVFPERAVDRSGYVEYRVGLKKFMTISTTSCPCGCAIQP